MREITNYAVNPANEALKIYVADAPGSGGASHAYLVYGAPAAAVQANPAVNEAQAFIDARLIDIPDDEPPFVVLFQNGPILEAGVNGLTHEVLLAIVADRLHSFQRGPYANKYNAEARHHITEALVALKRRTEERMARGVEGTHKV